MNERWKGWLSALGELDPERVGRWLRRTRRRLSTFGEEASGEARTLGPRLLAAARWLGPSAAVLWSSALFVLGALLAGALGLLARAWTALRPALSVVGELLWRAALALGRGVVRLAGRLGVDLRPWVEHQRLRYEFHWRPRLELTRERLDAWSGRARVELAAWPAEELARLRAWRRSGRFAKDLAVAGVLLVVSFWVTAPAWILGPTKYLIGGGENPDWTGTAWAYWWTGYAVAHGLNPFDGNWTFFPVGQRPVGQYNLLDGLIGAPMMEAFGPTLGYNAFALFTVWSTALAMVVLARSVGASRWAATLAGIGLVSSNFFGFELRDGRLSQTLLVFWILAFAGLDRLARGLGTWRLAVATGTLVAITHLIYWYNGLFLLIAVTPLWAWEMRRWDLARFRRLGLAAGLTVALCMPYIVSLAQHFKYLPGTQRALEAWMDYGALGRGEFGLNSAIRHSHWPGWPLIHPFLEPDDHRVAIAALLLAFGGLFFSGAPRGRLIAVLVTGYVLTLGPYLKGYDGEPTELRMPYLLLYDHMPFFNRLWWPGRMALIVMVPLLALASLHLDRLAARFPRRKSWVLLAGCLSVLVDVDARNAFVPIMGRAPETYNATLYSALDGPIITTPVLGQDPAGRHHLWFQVYHQQPILYGLGAHISSHRPVGYEAYIKANGLLAALAVISENETEARVVTPEDIDQLIEDGFRWAVVDPTTYTFDYAGNYYTNFSQLFFQVWGQPDIIAGNALAWRVRPIEASVSIPAMSPAGPSEFGKAPVLPGSRH